MSKIKSGMLIIAILYFGFISGCCCNMEGEGYQRRHPQKDLYSFDYNDKKIEEHQKWLGTLRGKVVDKVELTSYRDGIVTFTDGQKILFHSASHHSAGSHLEIKE